MASILESTSEREKKIREALGAEDITQKVAINPLVSRVNEYLSEAESSRLPWESQGQKNIKSYRGEDTDSFRDTEDPNKHVYIRTTTVKTRAAYSQIMESIMQNSRFPLMAEATPQPEGIAEYASQQGTPQPEGVGFEGDGFNLAPGATMDNMAFLEDPSHPQNGMNLKEGHDPSGQTAFIKPAERAVESLNKILQDQLEESNAHTELRKSVFEACLIGTGVMKGIFTEEKIHHKWKEGVYSPERTKVPKISHVSAWDVYVDPNAECIEDAEWVIERHRYSAKQMRDLKTKAFFDKEMIDRCVTAGSNYTDKSFEATVRQDDVTLNRGRLWEVLEYWGYISAEEARTAGIKFNPDENPDQVQVNMWVCNGEILRIIANPFLPQRLPYYIFNYERNPYHLYGVGVPEAMEDSQKMMNGFVRLAVENLALAGNLVFDLDETMLVPGQDMSIYPGKIFRRQSGQAGQAVQGIKFPSTANENIMMFREMRQLADEGTGIPSVSHGQTGVSGTGRTASGLNTILEGASLNIKTVIRNLDDDLLQPLGQMLFHWNNQFNSDRLPRGDFEVVATGIRSFTKQEIKTQRLQTFLQLSANQAVAPMIKMPYLIRELAKSMDLDPNAVLNDMDEAKLYAEIIGAAGGIQGGAAAPQVPAELNGQQGNTEGAGNVGGVNGEVAGTNAPTA